MIYIYVNCNKTKRMWALININDNLLKVIELNIFSDIKDGFGDTPYKMSDLDQD